MAPAGLRLTAPAIAPRLPGPGPSAPAIGLRDGRAPPTAERIPPMVPNASAGPPRLALLLTLALGGCLPSAKTEVRKGEKDGQVTAASYQVQVAGTGKDRPAQVFAPQRTRFSVAILSRPSKDPAVESAPWSVADEQAVPADVRAALEANGLRVGLIRGSLPVEITKLLDPDPPAKKPEVVEVEQPDGEPYLLDLAASSESATLLVSRDGRASGKDYKDAKGLIRVTAVREGDGGAVRVKLVPEIRHGPMQNGFGPPPGGSQFQPKEFVVNRGQAEETFRDLAATVTLAPGQILVVGGRGDSARGLGGFLFTRPEPNSDRVEQRLVLIWARPGTALARPETAAGGHGFNLFGARDDAPKKADRRP